MNEYKSSAIPADGNAKVDGGRRGVNCRGGIIPRRTRTVFALLVLLPVLAGCARLIRTAPVPDITTDWPTLLGNTSRSGYEKKTLPDPVQFQWSTRAGRGMESPLLADGPVLYAASLNRTVTALSTENGGSHWTRRQDGPLAGGIVRHQERLFVAIWDRDGSVCALHRHSGRTIWEREVGSVRFPPVVADGSVFVGTDAGNVFSLSTGTGEQLWRKQLAGRVAATPVPWNQELLVVATSTDSLYLLDRTNGTVHAGKALPGRVSAAPALQGDTLILPLRSGAVVALTLPDLGRAWILDTGAPVLAAPVAATDGNIYILNRSAELWRVPPQQPEQSQRLAALGGAALASLTLADNGILVGKLDGSLLALRFDGSIIWTKNLAESIVAPATIINDAIFVPLRSGHVVKLE